jgi:hypothetical protein
MDPDNGEKHRIGGGNFYARHNGHVAIGHGFIASMRMTGRGWLNLRAPGQPRYSENNIVSLAASRPMSG